ncbi:MAG: hypothetical protein MI744_06330, partial [Pseudomonadales bacterium]|nr:hypothetical protein [Pseudomonadales bacterium]
QSAQNESQISSNANSSSDIGTNKDLERQIEDNKSKSVRYQIIEKMLIKPDDGKDPKPDMPNTTSDNMN